MIIDIIEHLALTGTHLVGLTPTGPRFPPGIDSDEQALATIVSVLAVLDISGDPPVPDSEPGHIY